MKSLSRFWIIVVTLLLALCMTIPVMAQEKDPDPQAPILRIMATLLDESFDSYPPAGWTEATGVLADPTPLSGTSSAWLADGFGNIGTTGSARLNIYGTSRRDWMFTPWVDLGTAGNYSLEFDLALTLYASTAPATLGVDDIFAVVISTDGVYSSTNVLQQWNSSTPISNGAGDHIVIDLSAYTGPVQIGFYGFSNVSNADNDLFVDNVEIASPGPKYGTSYKTVSPNTGLSTGETLTYTIIVSNTGDMAGTPSLVDPIPTGTTYVASSASGGATYNSTEGQIEWSSTLAADTQAEITFQVTVNATEGCVINTATISDTAITAAVEVSAESCFLPTVLYEDFADAVPPAGWIEARGVLTDPSTLVVLNAAWTRTNFGYVANGVNGTSARINLYTTSRYDWLLTPVLNIGSGANYILEFDLALTLYNSTAAGTLGSDDRFAVVISTDGGQTWTSANILQEWTSSDTIANTGEHVVIPLDSYSGEIQIGFYASDGPVDDTQDVDVYFDNVCISASETPGCAFADGLLTDWSISELIDTDTRPASNQTLYTTWNDSYVYLAWDGVSDWTTEGDLWVYFYTVGGITGTTSSVGGAHTFPAASGAGGVDFALAVTDTTDITLYAWDQSGGTWTPTTFHGAVAHANTNLEIVIPRSDIGLSSDGTLAFLAFAESEGTDSSWASFPSSNPIGTAFTSAYQWPSTGSGIQPNDFSGAAGPTAVVMKVFKSPVTLPFVGLGLVGLVALAWTWRKRK